MSSIFQILATKASGTSIPKLDVEIIPVFQNSAKKIHWPKGTMPEALKAAVDRNTFTGAAKELEWVQRSNGKGALYVGLGSPKGLTGDAYAFNEWIDQVRQSGAMVYLWQKRTRLAVSATQVKDWESSSHGSPVIDRVIRAFLEGMALTAYEFDRYKSKAPKKPILSMKLHLVGNLAHWAPVVKDLHDVTEAITVTREWSNEPSNIGTPEFFAKSAVVFAKKFGLRAKVLTEADAKREKMGLFLGVGQGSDRDNRLVVLEYLPKSKRKGKTVALVGKGVTFDSGGISIKPAGGMEHMKHDMTGAATMFGAILLASRRKVKNHIVAVLAFAENMPSGSAIQPGNILQSRSGKTVEIINTDAEGRLVLADAIDYVHKWKPDVIVDAATLTGACGIALGKQCSALISNDDEVSNQLQKIAFENWERLWRLPAFPEYLDDMKSTVADLKNANDSRMAGTITAAMFLKEFVKKGVPWAHLDIAYTAYDMAQVPYYPKSGASGANVRTLAQFAGEFGSG